MTDPGWESGSPPSFRSALDRIVETIRPIGVERIRVEAALGRIAARDLVAPIDLPAQATSARDGFAIRAADTNGADLVDPCRLRVVARSFPDTPYADLALIESGEAAQIATGAALPPGADTVLVVEKAVHKDGWVLVSAPVPPGTGLVRPGDDVRRGTPIVAEGSALHPLRLGLLATTGLEHIEVFRMPCIGIVATGDEFGGTPPSNLITLTSWCTRFQFPSHRWVCRDTRAEIGQAIRQALDVCDAVVTIGGTGPGSRDLIRAALTDVGWHLLVDGTRLRPGRTTRFGLARNKPVFALPGRPTANEAAFLLLALPGLTRLAGARARPFPEVPARLARELKRPADQQRWTQAIKVHLYTDDYFLHAVPLVGRALQKERGRLQAAAAGHGLLLMEEGEAALRRGDVMPVLLLERSWL